MLEASASCQSRKVKSSKTVNENARAVLQSELPNCPCRAAQNVSETLSKPCAVEMPTCVLGEHWEGGSEIVQLSDRIVKRRIQVLLVGTEKRLVVSRLQSSFAC
jgi:hypothetical protein